LVLSESYLGSQGNVSTYFSNTQVILNLPSLNLTFWGVKGAEVPLREVGDEYPLTETFYTKKEINIQTSGCKS